LPAQRKKILICPLSWGTGHTTRVIPLISELLNNGHEVIFGGNNWQIEFIKKEIPGIQFISFPGFTIRYSSFLPQYLVILFYFPLFIYHTLIEHIRLKKLIVEHDIEIVISDSRPGLWNRKIKTVLITHMIRIPFPAKLRILENLPLPFSRIAIKKFTFCYIPDFPGEFNLSGSLSHGFHLPDNARYIGILSRFLKEPHALATKKELFCTAIMSGPSPQKEIFTELTSRILKESEEVSTIMAGIPEAEFIKREGNLITYNHLTNKEMLNTIMHSKIILSHSGYTTVMELFSIGRSAILVPTPGQAEQEYLAEYLSSKGWFKTIKQKHLCKEVLTEYIEPLLPDFPAEENKKLLLTALNELFET